MKKLIIGIVASVAFCFAGFALASGDTFVQPQQPVVKKGGIIVGADAGYGKLTTTESFTDFSNLGLTHEKFSQDLGGFVWAAHLGYGHQLATTGMLSNVVLGLEAGYKDLGKSNYTYKLTPTSTDVQKSETLYKSYAIDALATVHYYIYQGWHVFVKGGVAVLNTKYTAEFTSTPVDSLNPNFDESDTSWNLRPEVEVGTGYTFDLTPNVHMDVHVLFDHISTEPVAGGSLDNNTVSDVINVPGSNAVLGGIAFGFNPS